MGAALERHRDGERDHVAVVDDRVDQRAGRGGVEVLGHLRRQDEVEAAAEVERPREVDGPEGARVDLEPRPGDVVAVDADGVGDAAVDERPQPEAGAAADVEHRRRPDEVDQSPSISHRATTSADRRDPAICSS